MNIRKRKAISPLIATLLLIAIAVAASVLTYSWVMSMIGSQSAQAQTSIRIDSIEWDVTDNTATLVVRNTGSVDCTLESINIRPNVSGQAFYVGTKTFTSPTISYTILQSATGTFTWTATTADILASTSYVVRATTTSGFYYELVASTPTS
jgi:flagellin-like protein